MKTMTSLLLGLALLGTTAERTFAQAQDYPNRQVNFVVPFAPGGGTDILARLIGAEAHRAARQTVRDREPARRRHRDRPPSGRQGRARRLHLMMATSGTMAINPTLYKKLPYDPART